MTEEHRLAFKVPVIPRQVRSGNSCSRPSISSAAFHIDISKLPQQAVQGIGVTANVTDKIVSLIDQDLIFLLNAESSASPAAPSSTFVCGSEPS
jgi:hypothetical protein